MQGQPVQAIVVCSDGRQIGADPGLAQVLSTASTPIFTIDCAGPVRKDLAIVRLQAPVALSLARPRQFERIFEALVLRDRQSMSCLTLTGSELRSMYRWWTIVSIPLSLRFVLSIRVNRASRFLFRHNRAKRLRSNNRVSRQIKVVADKVKVLLVTGWPGWDFQYSEQDAGGIAIH